MTASPSNLSAAFPRYRTPGAGLLLDEPSKRLALTASPEPPAVAIVDDPFLPPVSPLPQSPALAGDDPGPRRRPPLLVLVAAALVTIILGYIVVSLAGEPSGAGTAPAPAGRAPAELPAQVPPFLPAPSAAAPGPESGSGEPGAPPAVVDPGATAPSPSAPPVARPPVPSPVPPPVVPPPAPAPPRPALSARYATREDEGPLLLPGYRGRVVIENNGRNRVSGWRVNIVLPPNQRIHRVYGARADQDGSLVRFTPVGRTRQVPPGEAVVFAFDVITVLRDRPRECTINDRPCD